MLEQSPLGKPTVYIQHYAPNLIFPIPRQMGRERTGIKDPSFIGFDLWTGYEVSWLNPKGKPEVAMAEFKFPCNSTYLIEGKSFKLYLNSFNQTSFESAEAVRSVIQRDLSQAIASEMSVQFLPFSPRHTLSVGEMNGFCLDGLEIETDIYNVHVDFLKVSPELADEVLYSHLLKSNCLATGQPDWASVIIKYRGPKIDREGLLKYIISYRFHHGFQEHCIEQIYHHIFEKCRPELLSVYGRYTRRGGLDVNPFRSNFEKAPWELRDLRQ